MSMYEDSRVQVRRSLLTMLMEIEQISDEEIQEAQRPSESLVETITRLAKMSRVERALDVDDGS